jgi:putative NADPH-quinone reductase
MAKRIAIIQGHPDMRDDHLGHALARAYCESAEKAGHEVRLINVAELDIPVLHSKAEWESATVPDAVRAAQEVILWADHLLLIHPLWLGSMPAALKAFLEQVFRPGFAIDSAAGVWKKKLAGRSARVVVTMGMPALIYRYFFLAHGLRSLVRNVLKFSGIAPVRTTVIGMVEGKHNGIRSKWLPLMSRYGLQGI